MTSHAFITMAFAGVAALACGCASTSGARSEPTPAAATTPAGERGAGSQRTAMMGDRCPMQVQNTTVTATDVDGGAALDFRTSTGDLADLRQRVRRMVELREQQGTMGRQGSGASGAPPGPGGGQRGAMGYRGGMMAGMMPAATATVEDIEGGARVTLRPKDPAQLQAVRDEAHRRADRMASGQCPMMSGPRAPATPSPSTDPGAHPAPGK